VHRADGWQALLASALRPSAYVGRSCTTLCGTWHDSAQSHAIESPSMTVHLDHFMIPAKNKEMAAERLAHIHGVSWSPAKVDPFTAVYVNEGLTIDFDE